MRKWKDVQEEKSKLERKLEMVTIRNAYAGLKEIAKHSKDFDDFIKNLDIFIEQLDKKIDE